MKANVAGLSCSYFVVFDEDACSEYLESLLINTNAYFVSQLYLACSLLHDVPKF